MIFSKVSIPLSYSSIPNETSINRDDLCGEINSKYTLNFPIHVLTKIIKNGIKRKEITPNSDREIWPINITTKGKARKEQYIDERDVEREITFLVDSISTFFKEKDVIVEDSKLRSSLLNFIDKNTYQLIDHCFNDDEIPTANFEDHEKLLILFILKIEKSKPEEYNIFKKLFLGSIIKSILHFSEKEVESLLSKNFKKCKIYFDANYLFSLLNYHDKIYCTPAIELFQMIKSYGFQLRVYDFTISEMAHVLQSYLERSIKYPKSIKVNSLYSHLKRAGKTRSDIIDMIASLEDDLHKLGIIKKVTGIDLEDYQPQNFDHQSLLTQYKPHQSNYYRNHDIALLDKASKLRKSKVFSFERAKYYIITSDYKLSKINFLEMGHKSDNSVSEIILDRIFTNILFLKNPKADISINSIISLYASELLVKRNIWERFYDILKIAKEKHNIPNEKIANLFYQNFIEDQLITISENDVCDIDESFVLDKIEEASKVVTDEISEQQIEFADTIANIEKEKDGEKEKTLFDIEYKMSDESKKYASTEIKKLKIILLIILIEIIVSSFLLKDIIKFNSFSLMSLSRYIIFVFDVTIFPIKKFWDKHENKLYHGKLLTFSQFLGHL
ncbi:MAG: hypothetical protein K9N07_09660 [Candidatus Cloacimonetes bacterium]|nr:hypothetical protein [Candidatus Cloacimonadota bacterium]